MTREVRPPTGAARRRSRLSDAETERRMLAAAMDLITEQGMTVSLDHLGLEEIIQRAGVARTSVYRRWPYKDLFFSDLLVELASATDLVLGSDVIPTAIDEYLAGQGVRPVDVDPAQDHRDFLVELLRVLGEVDFAQISRSHHWRTYIALHATHLGLPGGELRARVGAALAESERRLTDIRAAVFGRLAPIAGYRLVDRGDDHGGEHGDEAAGYRLMSLAAGASFTGFVVKAFADPALVARTRRVAPFGTSREAEWSDVALAHVRLYLSYLEPDPTVAWSGERVRLLAEAYRALMRDLREGTAGR